MSTLHLLKNSHANLLDELMDQIPEEQKAAVREIVEFVAWQSPETGGKICVDTNMIVSLRCAADICEKIHVAVQKERTARLSTIKNRLIVHPARGELTLDLIHQLAGEKLNPEDLIDIMSLLAKGYNVRTPIEDVPQDGENWYYANYPEFTRSKVLSYGPIARASRQWADLPDMKEKVFQLVWWIRERIVTSSVESICDAPHEHQCHMAANICASFMKNVRLAVHANICPEIRQGIDPDAHRGFLAMTTKAFHSEWKDLHKIFSGTNKCPK